MDGSDGYGRAVDVMRAWIDGVEHFGEAEPRIDDCLHTPDENRHVLRGLVDLCGSMLYDLEELTRAPMRDILHDHARRWQ